MKITKDTVVQIHYTLTNNKGSLIDSSTHSDDKEPLEYVHGKGLLLPKLEEALEGKEPGDKFSLFLPAKDGYGEFNENLVIDIPREQFDTSCPIEIGMRFQAETPAGIQIVVIKEVKPDCITIDANHELAGVDLNFEIEVVSVREATEEELNTFKGGCGGCGGCGGGECGGDCSCGYGGCGGENCSCGGECKNN